MFSLVIELKIGIYKHETRADCAFVFVCLCLVLFYERSGGAKERREYRTKKSAEKITGGRLRFNPNSVSFSGFAIIKLCHA
jgi:hypothetical protein